MAMIGYMGRSADDGIQFIVSREVFCTPNDMKWSGSARYATHKRHATHALTEFTGLDPDSFSFDILLTAELGVDPMEEIVRIWNYERNGEAVALAIGGKGYGKYRWNIKKHEAKLKHTDVAGTIYAVEVSLDLMECLSGGNQITTVTYAGPPLPGATYTVNKGDNIWSLAKKAYGDSEQYAKIYEANRGVIGSNPSSIYPGQTLIIPK